VSSYNMLTPSSRSRTFMSIDSTATATIEPDSTSPSPSRTLEHSPRSDWVKRVQTSILGFKALVSTYAILAILGNPLSGTGSEQGKAVHYAIAHY
jgi:hypothetical protein